MISRFTTRIEFGFMIGTQLPFSILTVRQGKITTRNTAILTSFTGLGFSNTDVKVKSCGSM